MADPCKSYNANGHSCADGFIPKPYCRGSIGCFSCGSISDRSLPWCLRDELPPHFVKDDGAPAFYREQSQ